MRNKYTSVSLLSYFYIIAVLEVLMILL